MEDLKNKTLIELQKIAENISDKHEALKKEIIEKSYEFDKIEKELNQKIGELNELEKNYINIIEELDNRDAI